MALSEETGAFLTILGMAVFGGFVSWMRKPHGKRVIDFMAHVMISAFAGLEAHFIASWLGMDIEFQFAAAGMAGYGGGALLDAAWPLLIDRLNRFLDKKNDARRVD